MAESTLRNRTRHTKAQNGNVKFEEENKHCTEEFVVRESTLTILMKDPHTSLHIRAIYHIFIVILVVLLCDTVIYDLVERGEINVGQNAVANGFGDIKRGAKLWLYLQLVTLAFYPALRIYGSISKLLAKFPEARRLWSIMGVAGVVVLQTALFIVPIWDLGRKHLALASSVTVTCEMFRLSMKVHAVAVACAHRCSNKDLPLPSFSHYVYFLFAPTLVYRDQYPRTKTIRWGVVLTHFLEVAAIIFYNGFLWERFILPYWSDYGKQTSVEAGTVVRGMFACVLPGVISFLCGFYLLLHAWLNAFAEMLTFGDRLFYEEWWTKSQFSRYFRAWNRVVHSWLRDYVHKPLALRTGRVISTLIVFLVSSAAHEVILALSFGFFYPVLLVLFGLSGCLLLPLTATSGRRFPETFNILMWMAFFFGNGILWSLYPMEYFARKNCPPTENDSFFIPKSWTCPEITLKPNWSFRNPLHIT